MAFVQAKGKAAPIVVAKKKTFYYFFYGFWQGSAYNSKTLFKVFCNWLRISTFARTQGGPAGSSNTAENKKEKSHTQSANWLAVIYTLGLCLKSGLIKHSQFNLFVVILPGLISSTFLRPADLILSKDKNLLKKRMTKKSGIRAKWDTREELFSSFLLQLEGMLPSYQSQRANMRDMSVCFEMLWKDPSVWLCRLSSR